MAQREPALVTPFWVRIAAETKLSPGWLLIAFPRKESHLRPPW